MFVVCVAFSCSWNDTVHILNVMFHQNYVVFVMFVQLCSVGHQDFPCCRQASRSTVPCIMCFVSSVEPL